MTPRRQLVSERIIVPTDDSFADSAAPSSCAVFHATYRFRDLSKEVEEKQRLTKRKSPLHSESRDVRRPGTQSQQRIKKKEICTDEL
jgi:hypothetical protein